MEIQPIVSSVSFGIGHDHKNSKGRFKDRRKTNMHQKEVAKVNKWYTDQICQTYNTCQKEQGGAKKAIEGLTESLVSKMDEIFQKESPKASAKLRTLIK